MLWHSFSVGLDSPKSLTLFAVKAMLFHPINTKSKQQL